MTDVADRPTAAAAGRDAFVEGVAARHPFRGELLLTFLTVLWGTSFIVIKGARETLSAGTLNCLRFAIATVIFLPFLRRGWRLWACGVELGAWLWAGFNAQAHGLQYTTAGRSAFVTSLNVIFVPALAALAGRRVGAVVWAAAVVALGGATLLCYDHAPANVGDAWTLLCALLFAVVIVRLESAAQRFAALPLTAVQLITVTVLSSPWLMHDWAAATAEHPLVVPWRGVLYLAITCTAITTWLQTVGQRDVPAAQASVIYLLEPVFASAFAYVRLGERMAWRGVVGAGLILVATLMAQVPLLIRVRRRGTG